MQIIKLLAALAVFGVTQVAPSSAQSDARWQGPNGRFSFDFQAYGWSELAPGTVGDPPLLSIEHEQFQQGGQMRTCFLTERRLAGQAGAQQHVLNAIVAQHTGRLSVGEPRRIERIEIGGVMIADATYDQPIYQHMRWFYLIDGTTVL